MQALPLVTQSDKNSNEKRSEGIKAADAGFVFYILDTKVCVKPEINKTESVQSGLCFCQAGLISTLSAARF